MSLIPCPACGKQISKQAPTCPSCGHPMNPDQGIKSSDVAKTVGWLGGAWLFSVAFKWLMAAILTLGFFYFLFR
ncbi:zinc ribbon domain-containing protein [Moraxella canis]|uniref:zinc ribbon domain-containing protein n=1 Tax=Moraxella canis TaxID=90239 RepID=UPI000668DC3B|nr:zinc ribbon domain-containing protein [Moraxella canis]